MSTKHPTLLAVAQPGSIVEFLQGNEPHLAWVEEASGDKLRLYTVNKRETKLAAQRLLPWLGPRFEGQFNREAVLEKLREHAARREDLAASLDPLEIWELSQGEVTQASAVWFAGLAFENPDVDQVAAMGRVLLTLKTHFKFQPPNFEVYPAETVERRLAEAEAVRERELVVTAGQGFFHDLWTGWASGRRQDTAKLAARLDPTAADKLANLLRGLMADPDNQELAPLWQHVRKGLPDHPALPLILAMEWGIVPPHHNALLDRAAYSFGDAWSRDFAQEIERIKSEFAAGREAPETTSYVSVDSPTTRDIDDAFHVEKTPAGWRVGMALARPSLVWDFASPLGRAVWQRASSLYLPEGVSHMLPEAIGCGLFSLKANDDRPALILEWLLDDAGEPLEFTPRLGWVRVAANLTYEAVERDLNGGSAGSNLTAAYSLAERLRLSRTLRGAVVIDRPEPRICLTGPSDHPTIEINPSEEHPKAQVMVSELMILANASIAAWAAQQELTLYHRVQDISPPPGYAGVWTDPVDMHRVIKQLTAATLELRPGKHASLAAKAYAPITSPLRRISDLVNMAQVESTLETGSPRFTREEMAANLSLITSRLDAVSQVQRMRPRYWKLVYMREHCREREFAATVVEDCGQFAAMTLTDLQLFTRCGRELLGANMQVGRKFLLRLGKVDPLTNEFKVLGAREPQEETPAESGGWPVPVD